MESFMRLSFITQFKIEFLLPFTGCRKVLRKIPEITFRLDGKAKSMEEEEELLIT